MLRGAFRLLSTSAKFESPFKSLWGGNVKQNFTSNIDSHVPYISDRNALAAAHHPVEHLQKTWHKATLRQTFRDVAHTPTPCSSSGIPSAFSTSLLDAARKLTSPPHQGFRAQNISQMTLWAAARQSPPLFREPRGSQAIARASRRFYMAEPTRKAKGANEWQGNSFAYVASKKESWWSRMKRQVALMGSAIASMGRVPPVPLLLGLGGALPFIALAPPDGLRGRESEAQAAYGACILSFLGGPHWGLAMAAYQTVPGAGLAAFSVQSLRYLWSVSPSLLAWPALLLPPGPQQAVLVASFGLAFGVDAAFSSAKLLPKWYLPMRVLLTVVAMTSLGATWAFTNQSQINL